MASVPYYFGSFNLNDGVNYFLLEKDVLSMPDVSETLFKIGRLEGEKKTGEVINAKTITVKLRILGISRVDLENKIDALTQAINLRQQNLVLHANDGRYYVADCIKAQIPLSPGNVVTTVASLTFLAHLPFALAANPSTQDTGTQTFVLVSGKTYQYPGGSYSFAGGGTVYSRPTLVLTAKNTVTWTQVQIQQLTDNQYLTISSNLPATTGDSLTIVTDPYATNGATAYKNNIPGNTCTLNGIFPVLEPFSTQWNIQITVSTTTAPQVDVQWQWTSRWLS